MLSRLFQTDDLTFKRSNWRTYFSVKQAVSSSRTSVVGSFLSREEYSFTKKAVLFLNKKVGNAMKVLRNAIKVIISTFKVLLTTCFSFAVF